MVWTRSDARMQGNAQETSNTDRRRRSSAGAGAALLSPRPRSHGPRCAPEARGAGPRVRGEGHRSRENGGETQALIPLHLLLIPRKAAFILFRRWHLNRCNYCPNSATTISPLCPGRELGGLALSCCLASETDPQQQELSTHEQQILPPGPR